ncbi:unnamed protein product [Brachionus calyciflorus]|uniref:Palmitoyltransferase n=1 Tax=Brachionus calyciflorus TaxID=104777 RepID=A0A813SZG5_9BILA|nr:unnamed protein product [Brachionus calyciflorus]
MNQRKLKDLPSNQKVFLVDQNDYIDHPLCLCEYKNNKNQRSHLLMCCCNCEALDTLCTSLVCCCCEDIEDEHDTYNESFYQRRIRILKEVINDIHDRIRIPFPGGARKLNFDYFLTIFGIYLFIKIGTINFFGSLLSIVILPLLIYPRFFITRKNNSKAKQTIKIKIGFYLILNCLLINIYFLNFDMIELSNNLSKLEFYFFDLLLIGALILLVYLKNSDPGYIKMERPTYIDASNDYCKVCYLKKDRKEDKFGHCTQCSRCIYKRDHHCFWIDNCVGYLNHKKFIFFIVYLLFIFIYSLNIFKNCLGTVQCKGLLDCLNKEKYYKNFSFSYMTLMTVQLMPLISYLILLLSQQILFISVGYTQYQLFRQSQKNIRFSLALFLGANLNCRKSFKNVFEFFIKSRNHNELEKNSFNSYQTV